MKTRASMALLLAFGTLLLEPGAQEPGLRLVVVAPPPPPTAGPSLSTSFDAARAVAQQQHRLMLLYFTAKW